MEIPPVPTAINMVRQRERPPRTQTATVIRQPPTATNTAIPSVLLLRTRTVMAILRLPIKTAMAIPLGRTEVTPIVTETLPRPIPIDMVIGPAHRIPTLIVTAIRILRIRTITASPLVLPQVTPIPMAIPPPGSVVMIRIKASGLGKVIVVNSTKCEGKRMIL